MAFRIGCELASGHIHGVYEPGYNLYIKAIVKASLIFIGFRCHYPPTSDRLCLFYTFTKKSLNLQAFYLIFSSNHSVTLMLLGYIHYILYRGLPDTNIIIGLIVKLIFIGFYIVTFSHEEKRGYKDGKKARCLQTGHKEKR